MLKDLRFFAGKALQLAGLIMVMRVIFLFFGESSMGPLLKLSLVGVAMFYGGTFLLKGLKNF